MTYYFLLLKETNLHICFPSVAPQATPIPGLFFFRLFDTLIVSLTRFFIWEGNNYILQSAFSFDFHSDQIRVRADIFLIPSLEEEKIGKKKLATFV